TLNSPRTMAEFDASPNADVHENGTIIGAALWKLREIMGRPRDTDLLLLKALLLWGDDCRREHRVTSDGLTCGPESFARFLELLLEADYELFSSSHQFVIMDVFTRRGVVRESTGCHTFALHRQIL